MRLGIVGTGYVGSAIQFGFCDTYSIGTYDIKNESTHSSISELCQYSEIIFVCVPTPMNADGSCDTSIVEEVVSQISQSGLGNTVVIKSTVIPGTTEALANRYKNIKLVFSPEFLTEANHIEDFIKSNRVIFGGSRPVLQRLEEVYRTVYPDKTYIHTDFTTAETVKYFANSFLATKVSFANEMSQVCQRLNIHYEKVLEMVLLDDRIGKSHFKVPGPDGLSGFGGKCFPKDLNSFKNFIVSLGIEPTVLRAVWKKNLEVREDRDWLRIDGVIAKEKDNE